MDAAEMEAGPPVKVRLSHAEYFLTQYKKQCGPGPSNRWLMIAYFDAFLFAVSALVDLASESEKRFLRSCQIFEFFVALRNISVHHSIPTARVSGAKFERAVFPIKGGNGNSELIYDHKTLLKIFQAVAQSRSQSKRNMLAACAFLESHEAAGRVGVMQFEMAQLIMELHTGLKV